MNRLDSNGYFWLEVTIIAVGGLIGGALGAFSALTTGGNVLESTLEGFATGVIGSTCGLFLPFEIGVTVSAIGGFAIDYITQIISNVINDKSLNIDINRSLKTGINTALGTAVPAFGNAGKNVVDSIGTIVIWAEASTLITCSDVIISDAAKMIRNNRINRNRYKKIDRKYYNY